MTNLELVACNWVNRPKTAGKSNFHRGYKQLLHHSSWSWFHVGKYALKLLKWWQFVASLLTALKLSRYLH